MIDIKIGDCREILKTFPSESINCCITSPPYYQLRDYEKENQIGLENNPDKYVDELVNVFKEVYRVLKNDGTLWLNLGDTYSNGSHIKSKNLFGIPWKVAFALQDNGWYLRQDIIWHKPNPIPEPIKDRCTKAHEYIFLLSKKPKYYFNNEAIREKNISREPKNNMPKKKSVLDPIYKNGKKIVFFRPKLPPQKEFVDFLRSRVTMEELIQETKINKDTVCHWFRYDDNGFSYPTPEDWNIAKDYIFDRYMPQLFDNDSEKFYEMDYRLTYIEKKEPPQWRKEKPILNNPLGKNKRSVWTVPVKGFNEVHFATFPSNLIEPCVLAGCPVDGHILDPFGGSGTTGLVADRLGRNATLIELNSKYACMIKERLEKNNDLCTKYKNKQSENFVDF